MTLLTQVHHAINKLLPQLTQSPICSTVAHISSHFILHTSPHIASPCRYLLRSQLFVSLPHFAHLGRDWCFGPEKQHTHKKTDPQSFASTLSAGEARYCMITNKVFRCECVKDHKDANKAAEASRALAFPLGWQGWLLSCSSLVRVQSQARKNKKRLYRSSHHGIYFVCVCMNGKKIVINVHH